MSFSTPWKHFFHTMEKVRKVFPTHGQFLNTLYKLCSDFMRQLAASGAESGGEDFAHFLDVVENLGVVRTDLIGLQEELEGLLVLSLPMENPAPGV